MPYTIYIDIETGGLEWWPIDVTTDKGTTRIPCRPIIEIAAIAVDQATWRCGAEFHAYVDFKPESCSEEALTLQYRGNESRWQHALKPVEAARNLARFCSDHASVQKISKRTGGKYAVAQLAGYNIAGFDAPFLWAWNKALGQFFPADWYVQDVMQKLVLYDQIFNPELRMFDNFKLENVAIWAGCPLGEGRAHTAIDDVKATIAVDREIEKHFKRIRDNVKEGK